MTENRFSKLLFGFVSAKLFLECDLALDAAARCRPMELHLSGDCERGHKESRKYVK